MLFYKLQRNRLPNEGKLCTCTQYLTIIQYVVDVGIYLLLRMEKGVLCPLSLSARSLEESRLGAVYYPYGREDENDARKAI